MVASGSGASNWEKNQSIKSKTKKKHGPFDAGTRSKNTQSRNKSRDYSSSEAQSDASNSVEFITGFEKVEEE